MKGKTILFECENNGFSISNLKPTEKFKKTILSDRDYTLIIDYPFQERYTFKVNGGMPVYNVFLMGAELIKGIYNAGFFSEVNHDMNDLVMEGLFIREDDAIEFMIGS